MIRLSVFLVTMAATVLPVMGAGNLLKNGDFEQGSLTGWTSNQQGGGRVKLFEITTSPAQGKYALVCRGDQANKYNGFITLVQPLEVKVAEGGQYLFQGSVKPEVKPGAGKSFALAVRQVDGKGGSLSYVRIPVKLDAQEWTPYLKQFTVSPKAEALQMYLIASNLTGEDRVYVDNISFVSLDDSEKNFDPSCGKSPVSKTTIQGNGLQMAIDQDTGLLCGLAAPGLTIHPEAEKVTCIYLQKNGQEVLFRHKGGKVGSGQDAVSVELAPEASGIPFTAEVKYAQVDGLVSEKVSFTATADIASPVKIGVRHGLDTKRWKNIFCALRPLRIISGSQPTIFSFRSEPGDLNLTQLDQYQRTVYPFVILENDDYFLLTGSRSLDQFVTISPNQPEGYVPSVQQNLLKVKKGQKFEFELTWKLFPKKQNMLRDVWRWYSENIYSDNPLIKNFVPYKTHAFRTFFPGCFASATYFVKSREERLYPNSNVWFYSWHDNINEWYPTEGSWWLDGNSWKEKMTAPRLKKYVDRLQADGYKLIFYLRQLANLRQRGKEKPESWFRRTAGGSLDLYGGGYETKLPANVAADVGYNTIPWGTYDFDNDEFRTHYVKTVKKVIKFYNPAAIGWDMGWHPNHMGMFAVQAEIYNWLKANYPDKKVVSNESSGPTQFYSDLVLLENGLLGGKSKYDFEIAKGQNTAMVCLERWNLFRLAVQASLTGKKTWLAPQGIAINKRYLDYILSKRPELKSDINATARFCQLRGCIYDLSLGASPGYLEEVKPVPTALVKMSGESNGLPLITRSFMVRLPGGTDSENDLSASAWLNAKSCRVVLYNDKSTADKVVLRLAVAALTGAGWTAQEVSGGTAMIVDPEGEAQAKDLSITSDAADVIFTITLPPFSALIYSKDK